MGKNLLKSLSELGGDITSSQVTDFFPNMLDKMADAITGGGVKSLSEMFDTYTNDDSAPLNGNLVKLFAIDSGNNEYKAIEGAVYNLGGKNIVRYAVDVDAYNNYKNSKEGIETLKKGDKVFVQALLNNLDGLKTKDNGYKYIARETGKWTAKFIGMAETHIRDVYTIHNKVTVLHKNVTVTEVAENDDGKFSVFSDFDDGGKAEVLSYAAYCGEGDYGAIPNGSWYITNTGRLRNYSTEGQFFTEETKTTTLPNGDDVRNIIDKFGFTFNILPDFKTERDEIRLHPHGYSTGCIALICTPVQARDVFATINNFFKSSKKGTIINLDVNLDNNEEAVSIKPKN